MTRGTFLLIAVGYYLITIIIVVIVLALMNRKFKKDLEKEITNLERDKNLIISGNILSELNKVEALINNKDLKKKYENWQGRFDDIKDIEVPKITDEIIELQNDFSEKNYDKLKNGLVDVEMNINYVKTKADFLLDEIKEITLSEERNRETIIKLKADYRDIRNLYTTNMEDFSIIKNPIELQFENVDKLFSAFEIAMDKNEYLEVGKIVKAIDGIVANLKVVIKETKDICEYGEIKIPKKIKDIQAIAKRLTNDGYNIDYLNIDYNIDEASKKITDIF